MELKTFALLALVVSIACSALTATATAAPCCTLDCSGSEEDGCRTVWLEMQQESREKEAKELAEKERRAKEEPAAEAKRRRASAFLKCLEDAAKDEEEDEPICRAPEND